MNAALIMNQSDAIDALAKSIYHCGKYIVTSTCYCGVTAKFVLMIIRSCYDSNGVQHMLTVCACQLIRKLVKSRRPFDVTHPVNILFSDLFNQSSCLGRFNYSKTSVCLLYIVKIEFAKF